MKKDRGILKEKIRPILLENCINAKVLNVVKSDLLKVGILGGTVHDFFTQRLPIEQVSDDVLFYLSKSLYRVLDRKAINPEDYFTDEEIKKEIQRTNFTKISEDDKNIPFVIKGVTQVSHDHWVAFMSAKELVHEFYNKGRIRYRMETQRQPTIEKHGGVLIKSPTIHNNSIEQIKDRMAKGNFITNYITVNSIEPDTFSYNAMTGELTVKSILDILDGFHRSMGMVRAISEGEIDYITGLNITNYDVAKALTFIEQEDRRNPMNKRFIKSLNKDNKSNVLIDRINRNSNSDLNGKIVTDRNFIKWGKALTLTNVMQMGLDKYFELETMSQVGEVEKFLVEGFNHIIGLYPKHFVTDIEKNKESSVMANENMFVGYLYILSQIVNVENWKEELEGILKEIDFSRGNEKWEEMGLYKLELVKSTVEDLENYISNFL